jgi:hypothetical protein
VQGCVGYLERKRPLRRLGDGRKDVINMDLKEAGWKDMDWINLAQDRTIGGLL